MNRKPLEIPLSMLKAEALSRRLAKHHPLFPLIYRQAKNLRAGYNGEKSLDFIVGFLPGDSYQILHNLRIEDPHGFFQIDILIICSSFLLIVEVKNISGTVVYDAFGQAIRTSKDDIEENLGNHLEQVNLQHQRLLDWLRVAGYPAIPIAKLITHTNTSTIVKNPIMHKPITETVIHKEKLLTKIEEFTSMYKASILTEADLDELASRLISAHTPEDKDILAKYGCTAGDVLTGVCCPECGALPLEWRNAKWNCRGCSATSKTAHLSALRDYSLLFGAEISNKQARDFLRLESEDVMKRLLKKANLHYKGEMRNRKYLLNMKSPDKIPFSPDV